MTYKDNWDLQSKSQAEDMNKAELRKEVKIESGRVTKTADNTPQQTRQEKQILALRICLVKQKKYQD